jgi:hypothetical protein
MRMPRLRFTVRQIMFATAVVAITITAEQKWMNYRRMVEFHRIREIHCRRSIPLAEALARGERFEPKDEHGNPAYVCGTIMRGIRESPWRAAYHARERQKYEHALWCPWEEVEPEPEPP